MPRPSATEDVFRAIADPTRRAVLDLLIARGEESVSALAAPFRMSLPAVSRHLRVLKEAGLVTERRSGKQRLYRLTPEPLKLPSLGKSNYVRPPIQEQTFIPAIYR